MLRGRLEVSFLSSINIFHTLNNSFDQAVARNKAGMESLKTVEEEDIELLSIKKDDI